MTPGFKLETHTKTKTVHEIVRDARNAHGTSQTKFYDYHFIVYAYSNFATVDSAVVYNVWMQTRNTHKNCT